MSTSFSIDLKDAATPALKARLDSIEPGRVKAFVGPAVSRLVKRNFLSLPHNRRGWTPTNFYADCARSTNWTDTADGVVISVNKIGARQRYHGGHIAPVSARALAIPVAEEAYGKTPADFGDQLTLVVIKGKGAWLALKSFEQRTSDKQRGRKQTHGPALSTLRQRLQFLFRLSAGVDQDPNPNILPADADILETAITAASEAIV